MGAGCHYFLLQGDETDIQKTNRFTILPGDSRQGVMRLLSLKFQSWSVIPQLSTDT